jgi:Mg2+-importing ATPase
MPMTREVRSRDLRHENGHLSWPPRPGEPSGDPYLRVVEDASRAIGDVLFTLHSSIDGINKAEAAVRRGKFGLNEIAHGRSLPWYIQPIRSFHNPFIYLLIALAVVSFLTEDLKAAVKS